ncbi:HAD family hydrolase [Natronorubrum sp. FCH18a]|uniref:HAD family hydrolase n=1 Tax=Natronorubrum sp. FCH18a TaxID=3447018 RepID=UPI003F50F6DE
MSTNDYPKAIFYDSKTTIFDWHDQWMQAIDQILEEYSADVDRHAFRDRWASYMGGYFHRAAFSEYRDLNPCIRDGLVDTFNYYGIDGDPSDMSYFTDLYEEVYPFEEASEALAKQQEYTEVWTFSNVESEYLDMMVDKLDMEPDFVGTMEDAGHIKPSPNAYRWVLEQNGMDADEVLYCAAPIFDVNGAMSFGMKCAYLNRPEQEWVEPQRDPHYVVSDLMELADMLEDGELTPPERTEPGVRVE